ncbi:MAG: hypothetical protein WAL50_13735 [Kineosporiaceae bacterium]
MSTLLRDVLVIPERDSVGAEDYVLRLTESVGGQGAARALDEYVVTPALASAFDTALGMVAESVTSGVSRGAFLTGSFGSGKSHFMAVLHALLRHDPASRAKRELQPVLARHDDVLRDRKVFPVALHLLAARSMEQALFSGYLDQVHALHPAASLPALHQSDGILADAEQQRQRLGDERFFAELNGEGWGASTDPAATDDPWANLLGGETWTAPTYEAARAAAPGEANRQALVTRLAETFFTSYTQQADYVDLDSGLAAMAAHAKTLGYDAVVLFLDELVLWLAFSVRDLEFFRRESQKLTKLVESGAGSRAVPLVSFVARQMDLRQWFADAGASGAEQAALDQAFRHQDGRFVPIVLGDDNLPYVANKRVLRRRDEAAGHVLDDAFRRLDRRPDLWDVLLDGVNTDERHRGADEQAFKLTYPFSPALVSTLRYLASVMQRERTALKVMQQMLVDRRDTLTVDEVVPVGDTFDYIVNGHDALDSQAAALFRSATALYREKLRPALLAKHDLTEQDVAGDPASIPSAFRVDDRLAKTLLLSAVAPKVPALKELTASRLASLNHGSIVSPLPWAEAGMVLTTVRDLARIVPEIHVGSDPRNPVIRVQLSDVDYDSVVERARGEDNAGRQRELLKDLMREALGLATRDPDVFGVYGHSVVWRGSKRTVEVVFGNVRDAGWLTEDHFRAGAGCWRVVIDHPFDDAGHSSSEDLDRLDRLMAGGVREQTVVWLPRFLSEDRMREVRRLVVLDWLLGGSGDRWTTHADHLSEVDRVQARAILESQRTALRDGLRRAVQEAYGAASPTVGTLADDPGHDRVLISLSPLFTPAPPVGADLAAAFTNLIDQAYSASYPAHPRFEPSGVPVTVRELAAVLAHIECAVADPDGRVPLDGDPVAVRRITNALGIGTAGETHFLFGDDRFTTWGTAFERAMARDRLQPHDLVGADRVREWIARLEPPMGLLPEVQDLVILAWAALRQRAWYQAGVPIPTPKPGSVTATLQLRTEALPEQGDWDLAVTRAARLLGVHVNPYRTGATVTQLSQAVRAKAAELGNAVSGLVPAVEHAYSRLGIPAGDAEGRLASVRACAALLAALRSAPDRVRAVEALAHAALPSSDEAASVGIASAAAVSATLAGYRWDRLAPVLQAQATAADDDPVAAARRDRAREIVAQLRDAVRSEEITHRLRQALDAADDAAFAWMTPSVSPAPEPAPWPVPRPADGDRMPAPVPPAGRVVRAHDGSAEPVLDELRAFLDQHPDTDVLIEWRVQSNVASTGRG